MEIGMHGKVWRTIEAAAKGQSQSYLNFLQQLNETFPNEPEEWRIGRAIQLAADVGNGNYNGKHPNGAAPSQHPIHKERHAHFYSAAWRTARRNYSLFKLIQSRILDQINSAEDLLLVREHNTSYYLPISSRSTLCTHTREELYEMAVLIMNQRGRVLKGQWVLEKLLTKVPLEVKLSWTYDANAPILPIPEAP